MLLDLHADPDHHRSVLTLAGSPRDVEDAVRALARCVASLLDIGDHRGAHPRLGTLDVVPFVALGEGGAPGRTANDAVGARDRFAAWASAQLGLPCFLYGPLSTGRERTLPDVRRRAFVSLLPDVGPSAPHPRSGAVAVGARKVLVAWNMWLADADLACARAVAAALRGPGVRALGFQLSAGVQVSCNLVDPLQVGPAQVFERATTLLAARGGRITRCELVGLAPRAALDAVPDRRWAELGLGPDRTIEARLAASTRP